MQSQSNYVKSKEFANMCTFARNVNLHTKIDLYIENDFNYSAQFKQKGYILLQDHTQKIIKSCLCGTLMDQEQMVSLIEEIVFILKEKKQTF